MRHGRWIAGFITGVFAFPLCSLCAISIGQAIVTGRYMETFLICCLCLGAVAVIGWLSTTFIRE